MDFFTNAIDVLQTLVIALGGGLCVWGGINLLEGYGQDNPASNFYFEIWNASVILAELLIATAIVVFVWVRSFSDKS